MGQCSDARREAYRLFVLESPAPMVLTDLDFRFIAASPEVFEASGVTLDQITGRTIVEVFPHTEQALAEQIEVLATGPAQHTVVRPLNIAGGATIWIKSQASYWRDDTGAVAGYLFVNQNVTAEHEAETRRREAEALLSAVIDNIPAGITVQDLEAGTYLLANARTFEGLGFGPDEMLGKRHVDLFPPERARLMAEEIRVVAETGDVVVSERAIEFGPAPGRIFRMTKMIFEDGGQRRRLLSINEDVTDARRAAEALERAAAEAQAANTAKSVFLANMSHEIRTPLNGVLGMVQAMAMGDLDPEQRERLAVIRHSGEALLSILNDALDLSKIEAGKLDLEEIEFDLSDLLQSTRLMFATAASAKGLDFTLTVGPSADGRYLGDPTRIRQILHNLISNAVKFTSAGAVCVDVERADGRLRIAVGDTGEGVSPAQRGKLFEKFVQADASTTRRHGGTGLGLAICKDLAALMGGDIQLESDLGQGSTFTFSLALERIGEAQGPALQGDIAAAAAQGLDLRILAAEDNPMNQLVLTTLLGQAGVHPVMVANGREAVEAWRREDWDVVLMDVQMPVMDGLDATRAIRSEESASGRRRTPIIALTANAMAHQVAEYRAAGMDGLVAKPIATASLYQALEDVLAHAEDGAAAEVAQDGSGDFRHPSSTRRITSSALS
jgi:PAS domain S-box-containing protein